MGDGQVKYLHEYRHSNSDLCYNGGMYKNIYGK